MKQHVVFLTLAGAYLIAQVGSGLLFVPSWLWGASKSKQGGQESPEVTFAFVLCADSWLGSAPCPEFGTLEPIFRLKHSLGCCGWDGMWISDLTAHPSRVSFPCIPHCSEKLAHLWPPQWLFFPSMVFAHIGWLERNRLSCLGASQISVKMSFLKNFCPSTSVSAFLGFHKLRFFFLLLPHFSWV